MTQLVLGTVGGVIGGYFGGAVGAQLGFALGSFVGGVIDPDDPARIEGPRIGDLSASQSTYGSPIPICYGTNRVGGNLIWIGNAVEIAFEEETGGKGGAAVPAAVQVTYHTFVDFAISFGEGPADRLLKLYYNKKLVYDATGVTGRNPLGVPIPAGAVIVKVDGGGVKHKFYHGTETQLPDPTIEAFEGVGATNANRGLCYIVVLGHDTFYTNSALPLVEAEIGWSAQDATSDRFSDDFTTGEGGIFSSWQTDKLAVDYRRRRIYVHGGGSADGIRVFNMDTLVEIRQVTDADITPLWTGVNDALLAGTSGYLYTTMGSGNTVPVVKIDPDSMKLVGTFGGIGLATTIPTTGTVTSWPAVNLLVEFPMLDASLPVEGTPNHHFHFLVGRATVGSQGKLTVAISRTLGIEGVSDYAINPMLDLDPVIGMIPDGAKVARARGWICTQVSANSEIKIYAIEMDQTATYLIDSLNNRSSVGVRTREIGTIPAGTWGSDGAGTPAVTIDRADKGLVFIMDRASSPGSYVFKWVEDIGTLWVSQTNTTGMNNPFFAHNSFLRSNTIGWTNGLEQAALIDTNDGTVLVDSLDWASISSGTPNASNINFYDSMSQSVFTLSAGGPSVLNQLFLNRSDGLGTTDGAIVRDISERVGFDVASQINTTELVNPLSGFAIGRQMPARKALEEVGTAVGWDGIESDGKVVFKMRGRAPIRTIDDSEMMDNGNALSAVIEERIQEVELPESISITFIDVDRDYQPNTKTVKRIRTPQPSMGSLNHFGIALAIVMTAEQAVQLAEKILYTAWNERVKYNWKTPWQHLDLDPADVVGITINGVTTTNLNARISQNNVGANLSIEFSGFREDSETFVSTSTSDDTGLFPNQTIPGPSDTRLFILDIPLIRDVDDIGRAASQSHTAMNGFSSPWPGGVLYKSPDGFTYQSTGIKNVTGIVHGTMLSKLPPTNNPFLTDYDTTLVVLLSSGELSSANDAEFDIGANAAAIGFPGTDCFEIIRFQNAVQNSDTSWTLSTLRRGRRGSDWFTNRHVDGEQFFLLSPSTLSKYKLPLSELSTTNYYKGIGAGQLIEEADAIAFSSTMADLRPWVPQNAVAVVDGSSNIDITFNRRTRVNGELTSSVTATPLNEDTESYEIDIRAADEFEAETVLILDCEGADAATTITDTSLKVQTVTLTDNAQVDTAQFKFGTSSVLLDGTTDHIEIVNSSDFTFGAGVAFTLEGHFRWSLVSGIQALMSRYTAGDLNMTWRWDTTSGFIVWAAEGDGAFSINSATNFTPSTGVWYHLVAERDNDGNVRLYADGVVIASGTSVGQLDNNTSLPFLIGDETNSRYFDGWVDNIRITRASRYGGAFTPPTVPHVTHEILRTLVGATETIQYPVADVTTDFGTTPAQLDLDIVQLSAQVGRGFSKRVIVDVE